MLSQESQELATAELVLRPSTTNAVAAPGALVDFAPGLRAASRTHPELLSIQPWLIELTQVLLVGALAVVLRVPNLQLLPIFTDEVDDIYRGLQTARGQLIPLTDTSTYIGSLWNWL